MIDADLPTGWFERDLRTAAKILTFGFGTPGAKARTHSQRRAGTSGTRALPRSL